MSAIFSFFGGSHSASSSLVKDGKIICCIEEERLDRIKTGDVPESFPYLSSQEIQKYTGYSLEESDHNIFVLPSPDAYARKITKNRFEHASHHDSHCYGAYFTSGMSGKVLSISHDGGGDRSVMKVFLCENGTMNLIYSWDFCNSGSLAHLWAFSTTEMMGRYPDGKSLWKMCKDEGKLMGMAPNGVYDEKIYRMLNSCIDYDNFNFVPYNTGERTRFLVDNLKRLGYLETKEQREIFSFNLQKLTEDLFMKFLDDLHQRFPYVSKLCFSGGLFGNVKLNKRINELPWVEEMYVYPPMGDEGLTLGACLMKSVKLGEITEPFKLENVFFGKEYSDTEIENELKNYNFNVEKYEPNKIAQDLHDGLIIGWFQNGFEYGPRALGARSILVRPTNIETHKELNKRLKRYEIMPFAPVVLEEHFEEIFHNPKSQYGAQFMTICYDTKKEWINKIPAVIQKEDKTARPQLISKKNNEKYWNIVNEYKKLSNIPVLLNTSFNSHNEPIIDNPQQALNSLSKRIIDKLVINDYVVSNK